MFRIKFEKENEVPLYIGWRNSLQTDAANGVKFNDVAAAQQRVDDLGEAFLVANNLTEHSIVFEPAE